MKYLYEDAEEYENEMMLSTLDNIINKKLEKYKKSEKRIDLHTHSTHSDGEYSPIELLNMAIDNNIGTFAITDHDVISGVKELRNNYQSYINQSGINFINGIELSAQVDKGQMHILGYGIDINNKQLNDKLVELKNKSIYIMISYLNDLKNTYGIKFSTKDIQDLFNIKGNLGRPHVARLLVKYGYVKNVPEAFNKYLTDMYERVRSTNKKISYEECISLIKNAGGYAILAHPFSLKLSEKELLIKIRDLISCGLDGIEVYHSNHSKEQMELYMNIVKKYNLLYSGGSDYHGPHVKPNIQMGYGKNNNLYIKELSLVNKIKNQ